MRRSETLRLPVPEGAEKVSWELDLVDADGRWFADGGSRPLVLVLAVKP
jgi:hypothetical protein